MFCSSLRTRPDWASVVPALTKASAPGWKEIHLGTHDVAFPAPSRGDADSTLKVILLSTADVGTLQAKRRIERLGLLDGGRRVAIVLLLTGGDRMAALASLQIETLDHGSIPIIPVAAAAELPSCLDALRRQQAVARQDAGAAEGLAAAARDLAAHCVRGRALSEHQANVLTGISARLRDVAEAALDPEGRRRLVDYLGERDGGRVISFLTGGPVSAQF